MTDDDQRLIELAEQIERDEQAGVGRFMHQSSRMIIRAFRIAVGCALIILALVLLGEVGDVLDTPFPAMTLGKVLAGVAYAVFSYYVAIWAWKAAFGPGPTAHQRRQEILRTARATLAERDRAARDAQDARESNAAVVSVFQGLGRKIGSLLHRR